MLRQLLSRSKAAIVHSGCVETELRGAGFSGAVARIPHGAWIPERQPLRFSRSFGPRRDHAAHRHLRFSETIQAHCRIAAGIPQAGARSSVGQDDSGGRAASRTAIGFADPVARSRPARARSRLPPDRGICGLSGGLRHRPQSALSHGRRKLRNADARPRPGQSGGGLRSRIVQRTSGHHLPESARGRERRRSSFRVSESAGQPSGAAQGVGRQGARMGGDRVYLAQSGAAVCGFSGANRRQRRGPRQRPDATAAVTSRAAQPARRPFTSSRNIFSPGRPTKRPKATSKRTSLVSRRRSRLRRRAARTTAF